MAGEAKRPNILLITADQLRADALGCYGNAVCSTPCLDRLAEEGVLFENAFTPNPICVPARASITTGNYSHRCTGVKSNGGLIKDGQPKLAEHFAAQGYETYASGKLHYVPYAPPGQPRLLHGFQHCDLCESGRLYSQFGVLPGDVHGVEDYHDYLEDVGWAGYSRAHGIGNNDVRPCPWPLPAKHHVDGWVADMAIHRMNEHRSKNPDKPFLIWCSFPKPHPPFDPPMEYLNLYRVKDMPAPAGDESLLEGRNPYQLKVRKTHALDSLSPAARQVIKMYYYALVSHQDTQVGRVLEALRALGQADNTIVLYAADHGELLGDFGAYFKCSFLKGSVMVPCIVKAPGAEKGARRRRLAGLQDILPTLASLADCPLNQEVDGVDLSAALKDDSAPARKVYYSQCLDAPAQSAMVTDGRWKYCYSEEGATEELYDLEEDPCELVNLAAAAGMKDELKKWRQCLISEARRLGDDGILDGDELKASPFDRGAVEELPVRGMGWRWY